MRGAVSTLPQYAFMGWCSGKAQVQLYLFIHTLDINTKTPPAYYKGHTSPFTSSEL
jgi:hypothetical protein